MSIEKNLIEIKNKKAYYEHFIIEEFEAGIMLLGTEIKSIKSGSANLSDAFCYFKGSELFLKNAFISEYKYGNLQNHEERRERKLLLKKQELKKLKRKLEEKGFTIIPLSFYVNSRGLAKVKIALTRGKKSYDKRATIRDKDQKRDLDRIKMNYT
jgi:SsrA-binding protein